MSSPPSQPKRRVPPPCWTHDETLALIEAYKERWFGLGRGSLKSSDWDDIAAAVSSASESGTKTSVQCRHKIEKLRKRYRGEKQRGLRCPGKFFSSWDLYPLLDSMNFVASSATGSGDPDLEIVADSVRSSKSKNSSRYDGYSGSNLAYEHDYADGFGSKFSNFRDVEVKDMIHRSNGRNIDGYGSIADVDRSVGGFPVRSHGDRSLFPPGLKSKNFRSKLDYDDDMEDSIPPGIPLRKRTSRIDDFEVSNGYHSSSRPQFEAKNINSGAKRGVDPMEELVSTIEVLANSFVKMERMKMEMVTEIEKMRMEMEMKHNQMILESQQQIVDAFANALMETKKRKRKAKGMPPDADMNGDAAGYSS